MQQLEQYHKKLKKNTPTGNAAQLEQYHKELKKNTPTGNAAVRAVPQESEEKHTHR